MIRENEERVSDFVRVSLSCSGGSDQRRQRSLESLQRERERVQRLNRALFSPSLSLSHTHSLSGSAVARILDILRIASSVPCMCASVCTCVSQTLHACMCATDCAPLALSLPPPFLFLSSFSSLSSLASLSSRFTHRFFLAPVITRIHKTSDTQRLLDKRDRGECVRGRGRE